MPLVKLWKVLVKEEEEEDVNDLGCTIVDGVKRAILSRPG
jgi:hypothetical protein